MNIYVGNLASDVKDEELKELFSKHGRVDNVKIIRDMFSQTSKGFGFVEMPNDEEAQAAITDLNDNEFDGRTIVVKKAEPRESRGGDRGRGGGGYGGGNRY